MDLGSLPADIRPLVENYLRRLELGSERLWITIDRKEFESWLGRRVTSAIGGAFIFLKRQQVHAILINVPRIDRSQPRALEIVVAEELIHMRDWIDGDRRGHAHHGYDRIAMKVAALTGASIEEVRSPLVPRARRPYRYVYACPACGRRVPRRRKGTWSCSKCSDRFDARFVLTIVEHLGP